MFSPRIQHLSAAKCQTIYAPVPPKENFRTKSLQFERAHKMVSSVTHDHVRDIRDLDQTTTSRQASERRARSPFLKKSSSAVNFLLATENSFYTDGANPLGDRSKTDLSIGITGNNGSSNKSTQPKMSGGFALLRENQSNVTSVRKSPRPAPKTAPPLSTGTTAGRSSQASFPLPGPFYGNFRGNVKLSSHNRQVYTPARMRHYFPAIQQQRSDHNPTSNSNQEPVSFEQQRVSTPSNLDAIVSPTGADGKYGEQFVVTGVDLNVAEERLQQLHEQQEKEVEEEEETGVGKDESKSRIKLPPKKHLENNVRVIINDAFLPRDNTGGWMFRQKWLRLFARNGANGLAYAYSSKLQSSFS